MSDSQESDTSDVSDLDNYDQENCDYFIVEFTKRGPKSNKSIDIVCKSWVSYNATSGKLVSKFMKPQKNSRIQYTAEDIDLIHKLVESKADAPKDWPTYNCTIRGRAKTYEDAKKKLAALHHKEDVFTTDSNLEPDQKRQVIEQSLKRQALREKLAQAQEFITTVRPSPSSSNQTSKQNTKKISTSNQSNTGDCSKDNTKDLDRLGNSKNLMGHKKTDCVDGKAYVPDKTVRPVDQVIQGNKRRKIEEGNNDLGQLSLAQTATTLSIMSVIPENSFVDPRDEILPADSDFAKMFEITEVEFRLNQTLAEAEDRVNKKMADVEARFTEKLSEIDSHLKTIQTGIGEITASLNQRGREVIPPETTFADRYSIILPCLTIDDVTALNTKLQSNPCREEFNHFISAGIDVVGGLSKSTTRMLKMCLRRQVALNLTAVKQMPNKVRIKEMPFAEIIGGVLKRQFPTVTEKDIWSGIGDALSNSKDWEGFRMKRGKTKNKTAVEENPEGE